MLAALVAGVCLAAGHYAFYASLQGREVSSHQYRVGSWTASSQQINTAGGTAFAFLVKASLVLASAIAYTQLYFRLLATGTNSLQKLDRWFSGRHDFVSLCYLPLYWRHGLLALVAVTVWLLPIVAIIAPAALSVTFAELRFPPISSQFVPQPAFDSVAFLSSNSYNTSLTGYAASTSFEPDQEVLRVANAAAASGSILPIEPPGMNASWQITIDAPKMVCDNMDSDFQSELKTNLLQGLQPSIQSLGEPGDLQSMFSYLAWSSWTNFTSDAQGNEVNTTIQLPFTNGSGPDMEFLAQPKNSRNDFFVAAFPRANIMPPRTVWGSTNGSAAFGQAAMDWLFADATLLHCNQAAVRYYLGFHYDGADQEQHINVISSTDIEPSWQPGVEVAGQTSSLSVTDRYNLRYNSVSAIWATTVSLIVGASNDNSGRLGTAELWSFSPDAVGLFRRDYSTQAPFACVARVLEISFISQTHGNMIRLAPFQGELAQLNSIGGKHSRGHAGIRWHVDWYDYLHDPGIRPGKVFLLPIWSSYQCRDLDRDRTPTELDNCRLLGVQRGERTSQMLYDTEYRHSRAPLETYCYYGLVLRKNENGHYTRIGMYEGDRLPCAIEIFEAMRVAKPELLIID